MIVLNLIVMNIIIAVLNSRYSILTRQFSREKYEKWLTKCLSDFVFNRNLVRGGRCREFLLHICDMKRSSAVERFQLRLMIAVEGYIERKNMCAPPCRVCSFEVFESNARYLGSMNHPFRWLHPISWIGDLLEDWFRFVPLKKEF